MALKAIVSFMEIVTTAPVKLIVNIQINESLSAQLKINNTDSKDRSDNQIILTNQINKFVSKTNIRKLQLNVFANGDIAEANNMINICINYNYQVIQPFSVKNSPIRLVSKKNETQEIVMSTFNLTNIHNVDQGMVILVVKKESNLELNQAHLENLRLNKTVDFYELGPKNAEIILYWKSMAPKQTKTIQLSFGKKFEITNIMKLYHHAYVYYAKEESEVYACYE